MEKVKCNGTCPNCCGNRFNMWNHNKIKQHETMNISTSLGNITVCKTDLENILGLDKRVKELEDDVKGLNEDKILTESINIIKDYNSYLQLEKFASSLNKCQLSKDLKFLRNERNSGTHVILKRKDAMKYNEYMDVKNERECVSIIKKNMILFESHINNLEELKNISDDKLEKNNLDKELLQEIIDIVKLKLKYLKENPLL
jgi:hypothetical protein